jgi:predicted NodU family carbamoyl transferase
VHVGRHGPPANRPREDNRTPTPFSAYERRTGVPVLINTSFNMHEEPIVMSPDDAARAFLAAHFEAMAIGPFLARRTPG